MIITKEQKAEIKTTPKCKTCGQPMVDVISVQRLELGYNTHRDCSDVRASGMYFLGGSEEGEVIPVITKAWKASSYIQHSDRPTK